MSRNKEKHHSHEDPGEAGRKEAPAGSASGQPTGAAPDAPAVNAGAPAVDRSAEQAETIAALQDHLLRLRADFDNFRKRTLRDKADIYEGAASDLMLDLLPVLDHFQLGLQAAAAHKAANTVMEGMQLIFEQLMGVLSKFGLTPFDVDNQPFDPLRCEAISHMASERAAEGMILAQARRGYMLRNKLLRPAQVVVSSGPSAGKQAEAAKSNGGPAPEPPAAAAGED